MSRQILRVCLPFVEAKEVLAVARGSLFRRATMSGAYLIEGVPSKPYDLGRPREVPIILEGCAIRAYYLYDAAVDDDGTSASEELNEEELIRQRREISAKEDGPIDYSEVVFEMYNLDNLAGIAVSEDKFNNSEIGRYVAARHSFMQAYDKELPYLILKDGAEVVGSVASDDDLMESMGEVDAITIREAEFLGKLEGI